mmetsp:Transcript_32989/g.94755  ORF Transcript_32989/g.94755 Transcript_32989/m.94755 type:complete len:215 (+) Transcript_32989:263-907(+)
MISQVQSLAFVALLVSLTSVIAFQIPHAGHQHPLYVRYRQEQIDKHQDRKSPRSQAPSPSDVVKTQGTAMALSEDECRTPTTMYHSCQDAYADYHRQQKVEISICTPVSYDEETGMVHSAVRAIVQHPLSKNFVDNTMVGISSTLVLTTGALTEVLHCVELELHHHAAAAASSSASTETLAILSLGHFFHYGREAIRQLVELHEEEQQKEVQRR